MKPTFINPKELGAPHGFNHGVLYTGGRILFLAGQNGGTGDFATQFERALARILAVIREAGGGPEHLGVLNVFVTSKAEYGAARKQIGAAWKKLLGRHYPAMAMYEVKALWEETAKVELEGIAVIP
jgi:enamine deaminase RidA (YjgF/YER057c/UK114 family)